MFDFAWSEIALIGIVALVLIGPKDLPIAIRAVTDAVKKMRRMAGELQTHVDDMVRDADMQEARDTFRDLRGMNIRGQLMRAVDNDGTLTRTLTEKPLAGQNLLNRPNPQPTASSAPSRIFSTGSLAAPAATSNDPPAFVPPQAVRPNVEAARAPSAPPPAFIPPAVRKPEPMPESVPPPDAAT